MNVQAVIWRELREASRHRETWRLRLGFVGGALVALVFGLLLPDFRPQDRGQVVLVSLAVCGFGLSLLAGAYLTADAVSSEKREGTLGLLFLTPLRGWEIVMGKMLIHSLRVSYGALGGGLLFFVPVLLGGVQWSEIVRIVVALLLTLLLSLACGMFWSTILTEARSAVLATVITMIVVALLPWLWVFIEVKVNLLRGPVRLHGLPQCSPLTTLVTAFESNYRSLGPVGSGGWPVGFIFWGSAVVILASCLALLAISGWLLPRVWRRAEAGVQVSAGPRPPALQEVRRLRVRGGTTERSTAPLLWLAARNLRETLWLGWVRGLIFAFFAGMLAVSVTTRHWEEGFTSAFCAAYALHLLTRIQLALTATRRLTDERRSGALEALLATPVTDAEIVRAHHASLKRAFRALLWVLLGMNLALQLWVIVFSEELHMNGGAGVIFSVFFLSGAVVTLADFAALRWLALREALRSPTQLNAAARAWGWLVVSPWVGFGVAFLVAARSRQEQFAAFVFLCWFAFSLLWDWATIRSCRRWLKPGIRRRASEG